MKIRLTKDIVCDYSMTLTKGKIVSTIEVPKNYLDATNLGEVWVRNERKGMIKLLTNEFEILEG